MHAVLHRYPIYKPIVAAVNGVCVAGGFEMLSSTDIRVAVPDARFAVMEPKRGLFAGGGSTVRLPRQLPYPFAMELLLRERNAAQRPHFRDRRHERRPTCLCREATATMAGMLTAVLSRVS